MTAIGTRVGAILSADEESVQLLGYGVYEGDEEPPLGPFGISWEEFEEIALDALGEEELERRREAGTLRPVNPKIVLDDGSVVWGQECWWGAEERIRASIQGRRVENVSIERVRSEQT